MREYNKKYNNNHPLIKKLKYILKTKNINYKFRFVNTSAIVVGAFNPENDSITIVINKKEASIRSVLSIVFHEVSHLICKQEKRYYVYNTINPYKATKKQLKILIRTAIKAEKYVDRVAFTIMGKYFPEIPYNAVYWYELENQLIHEQKKLWKNILREKYGE